MRPINMTLCHDLFPAMRWYDVSETHCNTVLVCIFLIVEVNGVELRIAL